MLFMLTVTILLLIMTSWSYQLHKIYKKMNTSNQIISCNPSWCDSPILCPNRCDCIGCDESGGSCLYE